MPRSRITSAVTAEAAAHAAVVTAHVERWVGFTVAAVTTVPPRQERRGRPGANTRHRRLTRTHCQVHPRPHEHAIAADARADGCWPLVSNVTERPTADVLIAYKHHPHLERRHAPRRSDQWVAPVFLRDSARIEPLMTCHVCALLVQALVEREIRQAMATRDRADIPLYPEDRACPAPSAPRTFAMFSGLARQHLLDRRGWLVQTFAPAITDLQRLVLNLLGVSPDRYRGASMGDGYRSADVRNGSWIPFGTGLNTSWYRVGESRVTSPGGHDLERRPGGHRRPGPALGPHQLNWPAP